MVNEIISTENTYISTLKSVVNYWQPMTMGKIFSSSESEVLFREQSMILPGQEMFRYYLKQRNKGFSSLLSDIFIDFSNVFKTTKPYCMKYPKILKLFNQKELSIKSSFEK